MPKNMTLPKIGVNMTEALITKWLIKPGDMINSGDVIMEAETDKSIQEILSTEAGVVAELLFDEGETVQCYEDIVVLIEEGEVYKKPSLPQETAGKAADIAAPEQPSPAKQNPLPAADTSSPAIGTTLQAGMKKRISPLARKIAAEHNIDLGLLSPSEPGNRIVKADVISFLEKNAHKASAAHEAEPAHKAESDVLMSIPMTPIRKTIASRLSASNQEKPTVPLTTSVDASGILALRELYGKHGIKLSFDAILAKVTAQALTAHRIINSVLENETILLMREINIGVAVDTPKGLVVPVLKNADTLPLADLNDILAHLAVDAVESKLPPDAMTGGTFTITNLGVFGVEHFTPIINPPECCILAIGAIKSEFLPDENDQPLLKKRFQLTLVFDHRIVDGATAAKFLRDVKAYAENPLLLI